MKYVMFLILLVWLFQATPLKSQSFCKSIATEEDEVVRTAIQSPDDGFLIYYVAGEYSPSDPGRLAYRDIVLKTDAQGNTIDSLVFYDNNNLKFIIAQLINHGNEFLIIGDYYTEDFRGVSYRIMRYNYNLQLLHDTVISKPGCTNLYSGIMILNHAGHLVLPGAYTFEGQTQAQYFCREMTIDGDSVKEKIYNSVLPTMSIVELTGNNTYHIMSPWSIVQLDTNFNNPLVLYTTPQDGIPGYMYNLFSPKNVDNHTYLVGSRMYEPHLATFDAAWGLFDNGVWVNQFQFGSVDTSDVYMGMDFISANRIYTSITQFTPSSKGDKSPLYEFNPINNQMLLYSTNINNTINWYKRYSGLGYIRSGHTIATADSGCIWLGYYWDWHHKTNQDYDIILIKMLKDGTFTALSEPVSLKDLLPLTIYPNPASSNVTVEIPEFSVTNTTTGFGTQQQFRPLKGELQLTLMNTNGQIVKTDIFDASERNHVVAVNKLPAGMYVMHLTQLGKFIAQGRVVVVR